MADLGPAGTKALTRKSLLTIVPRLGILGAGILLTVAGGLTYLSSDLREQSLRKSEEQSRQELLTRARNSIQLSLAAKELAASSTPQEIEIFQRVLSAPAPVAPSPYPVDPRHETLYRKDGTAIPLGVPYSLIVRQFLHNIVTPVVSSDIYHEIASRVTGGDSDQKKN